jgi:hypothetical protein
MGISVLNSLQISGILNEIINFVEKFLNYEKENIPAKPFFSSIRSSLYGLCTRNIPG